MTVASFIAAQRTDHDVPHALSCRALGVPSSTFYKWRDRPPTPRQARRAQLDRAVKESFDDSGGNPGGLSFDDSPFRLEFQAYIIAIIAHKFEEFGDGLSRFVASCGRCLP